MAESYSNPNPMPLVHAEVQQLYGAQYVIDDSDCRYTRANIRQWLLHWHEFSRLAQHSFEWATTLADLTGVINSMPDYLQDLFQCYCVLGYDEAECVEIFGWRSPQTFANYWTCLLAAMTRTLRRNQPEPEPARRRTLPIYPILDLPQPVKP